MAAETTAAAAEGTAASGGNWIVVLGYCVFLVVIFYFLMIKPRKKEEKRMNEMFAGMAIGDYVVTTSGFYGKIIDITSDMVILEFGGNKSCRIPMVKNAIARIEKNDALKTGMSGTDTGDPDAVSKEVQKEIGTDK